MVSYVVYGFRWLRFGLTSQAAGIRAHIVSYNLLDAAADYLQEPASAKAILGSFKRIDPNVHYHIPGLRIIEQYDPEDTSEAAISQPYAYVAAKVITLGGSGTGGSALSLDMEELLNDGPDLKEVGMEALKRLRDFLAPEAKIGWYIVYNGDPERSYPRSESELSESEDDNAEDEEGEDEEGTEASEKGTESLHSRNEQEKQEKQEKPLQGEGETRSKSKSLRKKIFRKRQE